MRLSEVKIFIAPHLHMENNVTFYEKKISILIQGNERLFLFLIEKQDHYQFETT